MLPAGPWRFCVKKEKRKKKGERNRSEGGINKTPSWYQKKTMLQCRNAAEGKKKKTPI